MSRRLPFEHYASPFDVEAAVLRGERPAVSIVWQSDYAQLMTACWAADPATRPTFKEIVRQLDAIQEVAEPIERRTTSATGDAVYVDDDIGADASEA